MDIREITSRLKKIKRNGNGYIACCPAHEDKTPSLSLKQAEDGRILLHCFAGCSLHAILSALQLTEKDLFPPTPAAHTTRKELSIVYTYQDAKGNLLFEVCRYEPKDFRIRRRKNGKIHWGLGDIRPVLYRLPELMHAVGQKQVVYLCEGEKDCDRLHSLGLTATTVPMGAGKWQDSYTQCLQGASRIVLLPDNDEPGRAHAKLVYTKLMQAGIPCVIKALWQADSSLPEHGDVSDFLEHNPLPFLLNAPDIPADAILALEGQVNAPDITLPESLGSYLHTRFLRDCSHFAAYPTLKTGFSSLDTLLGNKLLPGLYVLGAISSLGKTAFCGQLCDTLAAQGQRVLFFTLEMPLWEMATRSLVRTLFTMDTVRYQALTAAQVLCGALTAAEIKTGIQGMEAASQRIAYVEGNFNLGVREIREYCEAACRSGEGLPVVFVDYLQVLNPPGLRLTDKQATDQNIVELKRISRDFGLPVLVISSLNRQNYNDELNFSAFKESGAIEYSADFVMGLQAGGVSDAALHGGGDEKRMLRQIAKAVRQSKDMVPRPLEAVVLKNRRGVAQGRFGLRYWPGQNYFEEG